MFAASKTASASGGYQISRSLRFNTADSAYLNRTPAGAGNRTTWTWSGWIKRSAVGTSQSFFVGNSSFTDANYTEISFLNDNNLYIYGAVTNWRQTTQVFRDVSAWYHIVIVWDTTQATAANRIKLYVNGVEVTSFVVSNNPTLNATSGINAASVHYISSYNSSAQFYNGYMTEVNFIDGQALTPSSFGETNAQTGVWTPIVCRSAYGTNGFYLNFSDNSNTTAATLGKDYSGNGNNWTPNNFSVTAGVTNDSFVDTPTPYGVDTGAGGEVRGNYCTLNPLIKPVGTVAYSDGNLVGTSSTSNWNAIGGTISISTGKWYWEYISGGQDTFFGIMVPTINFSSGNPQDANAAAGSVLLCDDNKYQIDYNARVSYTGTSHPVNTIVGVAVDLDVGTIVFYLNGVSQGSISWTSSAAYGKTVIPMAIPYNSGYVTTANFGQRPFAYTAPSGFKALCTQNLPTPTIGATTATQAGKYFNPVLYTGNGTGQSITGVGFQPDWVWIKGRSGATDHGWYDAVRGVQKQIESNNTSAETTETTGLTSFDSDGFTTGLLLQLNTITATYVAWNWKANGAGSSNTAGSITSIVSANTTSKFSVVTYTGTGTSGQTVGHGLGVKPAFIIVKRRTGTGGWVCWQQALTGGSEQDRYIYLDLSSASGTTSSYWGSGITSSTFGVWATGGDNNASGATLVAYCFAPILGYSAFGSYTGNGSTDGPFVYTGMRPAYIMVKRTDSTSDWYIWDTKRDTYNVVGNTLEANTSDVEASATSIDDLSNGFKCRSATVVNASGGTYIYMAFAESPFKYSLAR